MAVSGEHGRTGRGRFDSVNQPRVVSVADVDLVPWSAEIGTDFETAEWILEALSASCSMREAAERALSARDSGAAARLTGEAAPAEPRRRVAPPPTNAPESFVT